MYKDKSRPLAGTNYKHSAHVIFEVGGVPATTLKMVCAEVFKEVKDLLAQAKKAGNFSPIPDSILPSAAWLGADLMTMGGHTGYAVMFSCKKLSDPPPRLLYRAVYRNGDLAPPTATVRNPKPFKPLPPAPHQLSSLPECDALSLLYQGLCSVPKFYLARLSQSAEDNLKIQQSRTAAKHRAISGDDVWGGMGGPPIPLGGRVGSSSILPAWMSSIIRDCMGGYAERRESAQRYHSQLLCFLDEQERKRQYESRHIANGALPCPMSLSEDPPKIVPHRSNGVIVSLDLSNPTVVYARCTKCSEVSATTNSHVTRLVGCSGRPTCWVKISEEGIKGIMEDMQKNAGVWGLLVCVC